MSERLHLALIIARSCPYYIFDEPLAAVDPFTRDFLIEMVKTRRKPDSVTLISTHLISDVEQLFDDVMMISNGTLIYHGDAEGLRQKTGMDLESSFKKMVADYV
jgi:ABC-2 type transport system ATP-binding protein